jgi:hypothetical protein
MKKYGIKATVFLLFTISHGVAYSQNCNCDSNFQWLKSYMERNYPGFKTKVNGMTMVEYNIHSQKYEAFIKQSAKPAYCEYYLQKWLEFFKDGHISIRFNKGEREYTPKDESDTVWINQLSQSAETLKIDSVSFVKGFQKKNSDNLEGIYLSTYDSTYTIAIMENKNAFRDYAGVMLHSKTKLWHKGQVKIELKQTSDSTYDVIQYMRNHDISISKNEFKVLKNGTVQAPNWHRILPPSINELINKKQKTDEGDKYNTFYKNLDENTSYLRIYSFDDSYSHEIDSVVKANMNSIKNHKYMILDLRNNGGGSDYSYTPLVPVVYSNPVKEIGVDMYSTPDNIRAVERLLKDNPGMSSHVVAQLDSAIAVMKAHPNQYISTDEDDTIILDSIMPYPKKVAILINRYCGSTTEQFLLYAKECNKVVLMGENTAGVLDYANVRPADFPCYGTLYYPVSLSRRVAMHKGIDGMGIPPEIHLAQDSDWIKEAENYLLKN